MPIRSFNGAKPRPKAHSNGAKHKTLAQVVAQRASERQARLYTQTEVRAQLNDMSRKPFMDFLSLLLGAHPTEQNVIDFAARNPDKWATTVASFAKMSGYNEEIEVKHTLYATVRVLGDMDLENQMRALTRQIGDSYLVDPSKLIESQPEPTPIQQSARGPARSHITPNNGPRGGSAKVKTSTS